MGNLYVTYIFCVAVSFLHPPIPSPYPYLYLPLLLPGTCAAGSARGFFTALRFLLRRHSMTATRLPRRTSLPSTGHVPVRSDIFRHNRTFFRYFFFCSARRTSCWQLRGTATRRRGMIDRGSIPRLQQSVRPSNIEMFASMLSTGSRPIRPPSTPPPSHLPLPPLPFNTAPHPTSRSTRLTAPAEREIGRRLLRDGSPCRIQTDVYHKVASTSTSCAWRHRLLFFFVCTRICHV